LVLFNKMNPTLNFFVDICRYEWFKIVHTTPKVCEGAKGFLVKPVQKIFTT